MTGALGRGDGDRDLRDGGGAVADRDDRAHQVKLYLDWVRAEHHKLGPNHAPFGCDVCKALS